MGDYMEAAEQINEYQNELFGFLEEFFERVTGQSSGDFGPLDEFSTNIKRNPQKLATRIPDSFRWIDKTIRPFYADRGMRIYSAAKSLGGLKLVSGGSGRIGEAHIDSIQQTLLYSDSILMPDPFLSWIETSREGERFREINLIKAAFLILQLKPIIDAKLAHPAIFVFPSWEKLLEEKDEQTIRKQQELMVDFFSFYISPTIRSLDDIRDFAADQPGEFLTQVEKNSLFVPPEGKVGDPISVALPNYEKFISTWRSPEFVTFFSSLEPSLKILTGILERLAPQYHLLENIDEIGGGPLICLEGHSHYYKLIARINATRLVNLSLLDKKQDAVMLALSSKEFRWLSRIPMKELVELRQNNENARFRDRLRTVAERLRETKLEQLNEVTTEINLEIEEMIGAHEKDIKEIQDRYSRKFTRTAVLSWSALGGSLIPSLAPYLGIGAPFMLAAQYAWDKVEERIDKKKAARSLFGVLARARNETEAD